MLQEIPRPAGVRGEQQAQCRRGPGSGRDRLEAGGMIVTVYRLGRRRYQPAVDLGGRISSKGRIAASSLKVTRYTQDKYGDQTASSSSPPLPMTVKVFGDL